MKKINDVFSLCIISAYFQTICAKSAFAFSGIEKLSIMPFSRSRSMNSMISSAHSPKLEIIDVEFHRSGYNSQNISSHCRQKYHYFSFQSPALNNKKSTSVIAASRSALNGNFKDRKHDFYRDYSNPTIGQNHRPTSLHNVYDDWMANSIVDTTYLNEATVQMCLDEFVYSEYGKDMFGIHERAGKIAKMLPLRVDKKSKATVFSNSDFPDFHCKHCHYKM